MFRPPSYYHHLLRHTLQQSVISYAKKSQMFGIFVDLDRMGDKQNDLRIIFADVKHNKINRKTTIVCLIVLCGIPFFNSSTGFFIESSIKSDTPYAISRIYPITSFDRQKSLGDFVKIFSTLNRRRIKIH